MSESSIGRRSLLLGSIAAAAAGACRAKREAGVIRVGYFPNLTHAPALTGVGSGRLAQALGPSRLDPRPFNAGPAAMEALLAGELDASYVGPGPVLTAWTASSQRRLHVVAGVASGGALFVVRTASNIRGPADLHGKRLATPQLGNTQDIALRRYLIDHGLNTTERGGDVSLSPISNANILTLFRSGRLDGAWVPEPWASRLVTEGGGTVLLDERDIWPNRAFATTVLAVRAGWLRDDRAAVQRLVRANAAEVAFVRRDAAAAKAATNAQLGRLSGHPLPTALLDAAWGRIDFTTDPLVATLQESARTARRLGFIASDDINGLVVDPGAA